MWVERDCTLEQSLGAIGVEHCFAIERLQPEVPCDGAAIRPSDTPMQQARDQRDA